MKLVISDCTLNIPEVQNVEVIDLTTKKIATCLGCFGCWVKTPGRCVIRDDAIEIYPKVAKNDRLIYITKLKFGSYDTPMKTLLERTIPIQQAFIHIHNGEAHHVQRDVVPKHAIIIAYGDYSTEEKELFLRLVERNAHNMIFEKHRVLFVKESGLNNLIMKVLSQWKK